jgi:4-hydroxybenzoate polyprenyltransferase/phosphoserine phosphatase
MVLLTDQPAPVTVDPAAPMVDAPPPMVDAPLPVVDAPPPAMDAFSPVVDPVPLVVDLDGTLLRTESLIESMFLLARHRPLTLLRFPAWRFKGRAYFKHRLAAAIIPDAHLLPYRTDLVEFLRAQKQLGRRLVLATAADERLAREVERDVGLFDTIFASDGATDLGGQTKRDRLVGAFGLRGFDYIGTGMRDLPIWCAARRALLASPSRRLAAAVAKVTPVEVVTSEHNATLGNYLHALRPLHWAKNGLVFVPLAAVHRIFEAELIAHAVLAFIAFCLCASGLYLLNDLLDLPADRRHPLKKERMLASGRVPLAHALVMLPLLVAAAFGTALYLSVGFATVLGVYAVLMIAYSMRLKDRPIVDVLALAVGYALRVAAGGVATDVKVSAWLLTFCVFLFFSLALIKRYAELIVLESLPGTEPVHARGYVESDKGVLVAQGVASGYLSVMVLALYTNTEISHRLYPRHEFFWGICLLLMYWVSYLWLMVTRGRIHDDPVIYALSDLGSRLTIAAMGVLVVLAL